MLMAILVDEDVKTTLALPQLAPVLPLLLFPVLLTHFLQPPPAMEKNFQQSNYS